VSPPKDPFPRDLLLKHLYDRTFELIAPFEYHGQGYSVYLDRGHITDFASIPQCLQWLISPFGKHAKAAVVHDYFYKSGDVSRVIADAVFMEAMTYSGVWKPLRKLIHWAVRRFGCTSYKGKKEDNI
jgi:hypothetical protein